MQRERDVHYCCSHCGCTAMGYLMRDRERECDSEMGYLMRDRERESVIA